MSGGITPKGYKRPARLNAREIVSAIGDVIIQEAPMLEGITENPLTDVFSMVLPKWAPRLEKLQFLQLGNGKALADDDIQQLLCSCCPQLNKIDIYLWYASVS